MNDPDDELRDLLGHEPGEALAPSVRTNVDPEDVIAEGLAMLAARWDGPGTDEDKKHFANLEIHTDPQTGVVDRGTAWQEDCEHTNRTLVPAPDTDEYRLLCLDCGKLLGTSTGPALFGDGG